MTPSPLTHFLLATALLFVAAPMAYLGFRGKLDTFTLRMMDINPLYWSFRWRHREEHRSAADKAFVRFFWRMNLVLLFGYTVALVFWGIQLFFFHS